MSQNPIEALGEQLSRMREALHSLKTWDMPLGPCWCDDAETDEHEPWCRLARAALRQPLPSPESLATLARHAEIGELLQQLQVAEPWFTLRYESVPGSSRVQTRVATPRGAFKADLFTDCLRAALAAAPKEPTP